MIRYLLFLLPLLLAGCYSNEGPTTLQPAVPVCVPVAASQSVSSGGQLANTVAYEFGYVDNQMRALTLTTGTGAQSFSATHTANHLTQLTDGTVLLRADAGAQINQPTRVVISRGGAEQASYAFAYEAGRLTKLTEARTVLPADWYVSGRQFTFAYTTAGDLMQEKVVNTFTDGSTVSQTTSYTASATVAPFANCTDPAVLTALALYYRFDALPARFWQQQAPLRYETTQARTGNTDVLVTRASFNVQENTDNRVTQQRITVTTYPAGNPFPQERTLQQRFTYLCK